jgi:hypothetical protein
VRLGRLERRVVAVECTRPHLSRKSARETARKFLKHPLSEAYWQAALRCLCSSGGVVRGRLPHDWRIAAKLLDTGIVEITDKFCINVDTSSRKSTVSQRWTCSMARTSRPCTTPRPACSATKAIKLDHLPWFTPKPDTSVFRLFDTHQTCRGFLIRFYMTTSNQKERSCCSKSHLYRMTQSTHQKLTCHQAFQEMSGILPLAIKNTRKYKTQTSSRDLSNNQPTYFRGVDYFFMCALRTRCFSTKTIIYLRYMNGKERYSAFDSGHTKTPKNVPRLSRTLNYKDYTEQGKTGLQSYRENEK